MKTCIFQIYFDNDSLGMVDQAFIPFDNRNPIDPDLYEFSVIYGFIRNEYLDDNTYYGFLSPNFYNKTAVTASRLYEFLRCNGNSFDAYFVTSGWDQLAYHRNVFIQAEYFHHGFLNAAIDFYEEIGGNPEKLMNSCSVFDNSVFSNYVIANGKYWKKWFELADKFYKVWKSGSVRSMHENAQYYKIGTTNAVFLQERLHSLLLLDNLEFNISSYDTTRDGPVLETIFQDTPLNRKLLRSCEALKCQYLASGDPEAIKIYQQIQTKIHHA